MFRFVFFLIDYMKILKTSNLFLPILWVWVGWNQLAKIKTCDTLLKCCRTTVFGVCRRLGSGKLAHPFPPRMSEQHPYACSPQRHSRCFKSWCHIRDIPHKVKCCLKQGSWAMQVVVCQHKRPRWSLLFLSDTAGESAPAEQGVLSLTEHLHLTPWFLPAPLQILHGPAKLKSRALHKQLTALHITLMEIATYKGQNAESTNFLKPRNNMNKCKDALSAKAYERIRENICNYHRYRPLQTTNNMIIQKKSINKLGFPQNISIIIFWHSDPNVFFQ